MEQVTGRRYFSQFLETVASQGLIGYWTAVEELRAAPRKNWHQLGAEIFYTFIRNPTAEIKVDKMTRKRMEAFLLGDKGPEVFYETQQSVVQTLEDKYYQPFIISDYYKQMLVALESEEGISEVDGGSVEDQVSGGSVGNEDCGLNVGDHSNYARRKLDQLQEKLNNKMQVKLTDLSKEISRASITSVDYYYYYYYYHIMLILNSIPSTSTHQLPKGIFFFKN